MGRPHPQKQQRLSCVTPCSSGTDTVPFCWQHILPYRRTESQHWPHSFTRYHTKSDRRNITSQGGIRVFAVCSRDEKYCDRNGGKIRAPRLWTGHRWHSHEASRCSPRYPSPPLQTALLVPKAILQYQLHGKPFSHLKLHLKTRIQLSLMSACSC